MADKEPRERVRRANGFRRTGMLLSRRFREVGEARGFAVSRVLTHWSEIVGADLASRTRPVEVTYGRGGFGATLTVLTSGALAPMVEMQKEKLRDRVNACYGYNAISNVRVTQTAATGFSEGRVSFGHRRKDTAPAPDASVTEAARALAADVEDEALRVALSDLAANILAKSENVKGKA